MPKNKQQEAQEKRLQKNIRQAKKTGADAKQGKTKSARSKPSKKGGFFAGLKADAPQTVQQSIPYREMYRDGICRLTDTLYTKTVQFFDINYQLAQADDKAQIFEGYCDFLNYFDASIHVQLTFINQRANMQDFTKSIDIPPRGDEYDGIRREYGDMLKNQLQKGNNGLTKRKYITFGIEADDLRTAKMRLERIETDVLANFKTLGVQARSLNGLERLELLHSQLHPDGQEKFHFQWSDLPKTGLSTKDFVSPSGLSFSKDGKTFRVGDHSGAVSFLQILAPELTDRLLADLLDLNDAVTVNLRPAARGRGGARRRCGGRGRWLSGYRARRGECPGDGVRLLRLLGPQALRSDGNRRAVRPPGAARGDAALSGRRRHGRSRDLCGDDLRPRAAQVRGRQQLCIKIQP